MVFSVTQLCSNVSTLILKATAILPNHTTTIYGLDTRNPKEANSFKNRTTSFLLKLFSGAGQVSIWLRPSSVSATLINHSARPDSLTRLVSVTISSGMVFFLSFSLASDWRKIPCLSYLKSSDCTPSTLRCNIRQTVT